MRPLLDEAQARIDHRGAVPEQRRQRDGGQREHRDRQRTERAWRSQPPERDDADEGRQHDHLAREPRGAPHHRRAPGAFGPAEMEERSTEPDDEHRRGDDEQRLAE